MYKYIYLIRPIHLDKVKIGYWSGTVNSLRSRYKMYYGLFEMYLFQCDQKSNENFILKYFEPKKWMGELFEVEIMDEFMNIMSQISYNHCKSVDMEQTFIKINHLKKVNPTRNVKLNQINNVKRIYKDVKKAKLMIIEMRKIYKDVLKELKEKCNKKDIRNELSIERDIQMKFIMKNTEYKQDKVIFMNDLRDKYTKNIDNDILNEIDTRYIIERINICKHCINKHIKKCCENYNKIDRSTRNTIRNIQFVDYPK